MGNLRGWRAKVGKPSWRGWSLVELMIVAGVLGLLAAMVPRGIMVVSDAVRIHTAQGEIGREMRSIRESFMQFIPQGDIATVTVDRLANQPYCSRLSFSETSGESVAFWQEGRKLWFRRGTVTRELTSNVRHLSFTFADEEDPSRLTITVGVDRRRKNGQTLTQRLTVDVVQIMN